MELSKIDIRYHYYFPNDTFTGNREFTHVKQLPYLSVVQSKYGSYRIRLGDGEAEETEEGGMFIAPKSVTQTITHRCIRNRFSLRFVFLDVFVNGRYHLDDIYDFPLCLTRAEAEPLDRIFDELDHAEGICDTMSCLYRFVGELLRFGTEKPYRQNESILPLIRYIENNFRNEITVADMAKLLTVSESSLFSEFKKATGITPIRYLNDYRLSVASYRLLHSDDPINKICGEVGIPDPFYFSKLFKQKFHCSPQTYRRAYPFQ